LCHTCCTWYDDNDHDSFENNLTELIEHQVV
jgi:hypothetical protein